jgi:hypothetical protein
VLRILLVFSPPLAALLPGLVTPWSKWQFFVVGTTFLILSTMHMDSRVLDVCTLFKRLPGNLIVDVGVMQMYLN